MTNTRVLGAFTLNCPQTGHWVRVDYYIVMNWTHVQAIIQCQSDGCSLSCKDCAVVWQAFGQLAAGCLTILEVAVDVRRFPHSLIHFGAISINFFMWVLCFTIFIEFSLGFLSGDHAFAHSFNEFVSLGIIIVHSWWKAGCPQGADQFNIDLCRGHGCLYLEPMAGVGGWVMPPLLFGQGAYRSLVVRSNSWKVWYAGLSMQAQVFRYYCKDSFNRRSSKGVSLASVYRQEIGLVHNAPNASLNPELWMPSSCCKLVFDAVGVMNSVMMSLCDFEHYRLALMKQLLMGLEHWGSLRCWQLIKLLPNIVVLAGCKSLTTFQIWPVAILDVHT